jgi:hypothetical protein
MFPLFPALLFTSESKRPTGISVIKHFSLSLIQRQYKDLRVFVPDINFFGLCNICGQGQDPTLRVGHHKVLHSGILLINLAWTKLIFFTFDSENSFE